MKKSFTDSRHRFYGQLTLGYSKVLLRSQKVKKMGTSTATILIDGFFNLLRQVLGKEEDEQGVEMGMIDLHAFEYFVNMEYNDWDQPPMRSHKTQPDSTYDPARITTLKLRPQTHDAEPISFPLLPDQGITRKELDIIKLTAQFVSVFGMCFGQELMKSAFMKPELEPFFDLLGISREKSSISEETLRAAFSATEEGFLTLVRRTCGLKPLIAAVGSCCLVGVIWKGTLLIANVGDSRAVLGSSNRSNKIVAEQLTSDHNAALEEVRQELRSLHPDDSHIVVLKHGVWRIKGIIQVSKSIGDAYLKRPEFSLDPSFPRFHLAERLQRPVLSAEPSVYTRVLQTSDKFVIFASDGLWEHMTNQQAVDIVNKNPRPGIARKLVRRAMNIAAKKREMSYDDLKKVERGVRRFFHDDITVVVIFIDNELLMVEKATVPELSIKGFSHTVGPSKFSIFFS
ncbi:PREDICTED: probable protein phosphatase 2C 68 isoform X2 [Camelina sativa]|uniref:Probable protein phosphatase 2C 68 isoform X2 n=1 Tax=Camelina sativa TaxID=90675 RepID=A0ABM0TAH3_CAMSA|nr:PREDICTED: probable protein phosphatase 2C 68 isoform X2 [Camelina sativa]